MASTGKGVDDVDDNRGWGKEFLGEFRIQGGGDVEAGFIVPVAVGAVEVEVGDVGIGFTQEVLKAVEGLDPDYINRRVPGPLRRA